MCLDMMVAFNKHIVVRHLYQRPAQGGDEVVLPPIFSKDPTMPGTLEVGYLGPLWNNTEYMTIMPPGGTGLFGHLE